MFYQRIGGTHGAAASTRSKEGVSTRAFAAKSRFWRLNQNSGMCENGVDKK